MLVIGGCGLLGEQIFEQLTKVSIFLNSFTKERKEMRCEDPLLLILKLSLKDGRDVFIFDRDPSFLPPFCPLSHFFCGDVRDIATLKTAMKGISSLHLSLMQAFSSPSRSLTLPLLSLSFSLFLHRCVCGHTHSLCCGSLSLPFSHSL